MTWRESFLYHFGPGLLGGITLGDWLKLLFDNRFRVALSCWPRAMSISFHCIQTSVWRRWENWRYRSRFTNVTIPPPLFLLGHWRSGTTHLHNLMTVDDRFAFPNNYQVMFPHTFLSTESAASRMMAFFFPKRRPMDNIEWNLQSPQEDEFAILIASGISSYMGWILPQRREQYGRYLTFRDASESDITRWKETFVWFLKKLTWKYNKPLVLKSPPHTARIKLLLQLFPDARFVHIHRNPYPVFQSSKLTFQVNIGLHRLQRVQNDLDDWLLRQYRQIYDVFFEERKLIPEGRFHEVCFEQLEEDPMGQVKRLYETLGLPDFGHVEPALRTYVDSIAGYKKNRFPDLPAEMRTRIANEWRPCFEEWGYPV